jgi:TolA-binding protein
MASNSIPDALIYNSIQNNNHNAPWVKIAQSPNDLVDVRYNYWGNDFYPEQDLSPFTSFEFEPIWIPGNVPYIEETTAAALYRIAYNHEIAEEYVEAIAGYKQMISEFPDTEHAILVSCQASIVG